MTNRDRLGNHNAASSTPANAPSTNVEQATGAGASVSSTPVTPILAAAETITGNQTMGASPTSMRFATLQNYHLLLFRKALHPEFFGIEGRRRVQHGEYETESWIFKGGHAVRFQLGGQTLCEVVYEHIDQIPDRGLVAALPCAGERDFEEKVAENLLYMTTMQTEQLSDHLYVGTYKELMQHARENNSLFTSWTDPCGKQNLSVIDVQRFRSEVHIQGYHLRSDCGLVLRTQSMLQIVTPKVGATPTKPSTTKRSRES